MRLKIHRFIGVVTLLMAAFAGSLPSDTAASSSPEVTTNATNASRNRPPEVVAVSYRAPTFSGFANSATAVQVQDRSSVSAEPAVDVWTMLVALLGLVGLRLWHGGKRRQPVIQ